MAHAAAVRLVDGRAIGDEALAPFVAWLSPGEAQRYARFVRPLRRRQFLIGRILLRQALGKLLGVPAATVELVEQPGNAPRLAWPDSALPGFSLSHSGPWVACAVSADTKLGLDIEQIDPARDVLALAAQAFDQDEIAWLCARPDASRMRDFYQLWSTREARFKLNAPGAHCISLAHAQLSVVLCSARPLPHRPELVPASLIVR
jgi:4'-phosphopantetheinyl transferase